MKDADDQRIKRTSNGVVTHPWFLHYEEEQVTVWPYPVTAIKYYTFNGMRIAVKRGNDLHYILTDHLGSTSGQTDVCGNAVNGSDTRFNAYGSLRAGDPAALSTDRTFTGQKSDGTGLLYMNALYYDPQLGAFLSPDTVAPDAQPLREPPHDDAFSVCPAHWSYAMILTDLYGKNTYDKNTAISPLS